MTTLTVGQILDHLAEAYPMALAESWDQVGLAVGDPTASVDTIVFALDLTDDVIDQAIHEGAQLIVTHHPLLLRGVHAIRRDQPKGRLVLSLVEAGIALISMHTNADSARNGVCDALASAIGVVETRPLEPVSASLNEISPGAGLGRVGRLAAPMSARDFTAQVAAALPPTPTGARLGGDPDRTVSTVAVLAGSGDSFLDAARATGVDVYVTSDLRHHPAMEFLQWEGGPALIDIPHWAAEWLWLPVAEQLLVDFAATHQAPLTTMVSRLNTDPWVLRVGTAE